ncbi:NAD-dependent epimerase/dehydratase family protein [Legionella longbeachae]|uniref:NAD-dependent epimerase/dehydratase domain-containing protein n=1 Tax=Legionella longbeachae serogroup 1 (strain NSW150) TaxID=661367 RepID=D3HJN4_LEGLN|nr:NAD-dependent epimerase/dehydratase family protein [Legionella longbeachae]VEE03163.1 Putative NADH-flavin reductase [Legionella oakridgensis]HBD7398966.1 epimerase [Legionella pneumophila]ARB93937.1 epimerase [Legionella longbeachae]ARM32925.1 epimerase [Legionella longbeachae]EEZ94255.1 conserved hypothetical protein [Legionella longbeachae D-4968]
MKSIIIYGATGMLGQAVLRESLLDAHIEQVTVIGRSPIGQTHPKLREIVHANLFDYHNIEEQLIGIDACFYCLGTPSTGKTEAEYTRITKDLTVTAAKILLRLNPHPSFIYISGEGADSSEKGVLMWARVRGQTENELLRMPFKRVYIVRPGIIQPLNGIKSRVRLYRLGYSMLKPILPMLRYFFPTFISSTQLLGQAMIKIARDGYEKPILRNKDLYMLGLSK